MGENLMLKLNINPALAQQIVANITDLESNGHDPWLRPVLLKSLNELLLEALRDVIVAEAYRALEKQMPR